MTLPGSNVLLIGRNLHNALALTHRLRGWGFRSHFADSMREAFDLLSSRPVDLVLSNAFVRGDRFWPISGFRRPSGYRVPLLAGRQ